MEFVKHEAAFLQDEDVAQHALGVLDDLFFLVDTEKIFESRDAHRLRQLRSEARSALNCLLVWQRPLLEATRGIMWPYRGFKERYTAFMEFATARGDEFRRQQARLFLAFLPFPQQWRWMCAAQKMYPDDPEVKDFVHEERLAIANKIGTKPQKRYKLRHLCQVLKRPRGATEKGVLRIFSLPYLFIHPELLAQLSSRYVLYLEPPMGIVFRHAWWRHFTELKDPCIFGLASAEDRCFALDQQNVVATPLAHGDFLEDTAIPEGDSPKELDIVFNSTFDDMDRKRHRRMLQLLKHPLLQELRVLFLGRGETTNVQAFTDQARQEGLAARVKAVSNLRRAEVPRWLGRCKIGVHLSLYENACRSIYEFFRSDLPCVISSSMGGMNLDIFNSQTGRAVPDQDLPRAIASVLAGRKDFSPRRWFLDHSGSIKSSARLNEELQSLFHGLGYDWRSDIVPMGSSGASRYVNESDYHRFRSEYEWLLSCFKRLKHWGLEFSVE